MKSVSTLWNVNEWQIYERNLCVIKPAIIKRELFLSLSKDWTLRYVHTHTDTELKWWSPMLQQQGFLELLVFPNI